MKKIILKTLIVIPLLVPFVSMAIIEPVPGCENSNLFNTVDGSACVNIGGGTTVNGPSGTVNSGSSSSAPLKSTLSVSTDKATDVSNTSATLRGRGSDIGLNKTTAYFRYSTLPVSPIFCNDIYGANMISTVDIRLKDAGVLDPSEKTFFQKINNLTPDTTYYYCAILSNKDNIAYGGQGIVQAFHTKCFETAVITLDATNVDSTSATLQGSYCSNSTIKTSFQYREAVVGQIVSLWKTVAVQNHLLGTNSNLYGNYNFDLSGLKSDSKYEFKAVGENGTAPSIDHSEGVALNFTTDASVDSGNITITGGSGDGGTVGSTTSNEAGNNGIASTPLNNVVTQTPVNTGNLQLGTVITPPGDAVVHFHEGIETVLERQIVANTALQQAYGYQAGTDLQTFAWNLADVLARMFGYVSPSGKEIRVMPPDVAAYQLVFIGNQLTVYEYFYGKIVNIRTVTNIFKSAAGYEYYFTK